MAAQVWNVNAGSKRSIENRLALLRLDFLIIDYQFHANPSLGLPEES